MPKINQEEYEILKGLDDKWKWIARNYNGALIIYTSKPMENPNLYWDGFGERMDDRLFQFIQWEDEEPYNIQELIEEYEYSTEHVSHVVNERVKVLGKTWSESEEREVNKQKLIEKWESAIGGAEFYGKGKEDRLIEYMRNFVDDLNQLDEPEVLSQEFIDKYKVDYDNWMPAVPIVHLQNLLVPKQEVTIGKEDAENIVQYKEMGWTLSHLINDYGEDARHDELLAKAWLAYPNIEVGEEQKYYAKIKGHENIGSNDKYWNYNTDMEELSIGDSEVHPNVISEYILKATKDEWANLGITDDNADFELVEEMEE